MIGPTCPDCETIHSAGDVVVYGSRFTPGPMRYQAKAGGPIRATRVAAMLDVCASRHTVASVA